MIVYKNGIDASTLQFKVTEIEMEVTIKGSVDTISELPTEGNVNGDAYMAIDTDHLYVQVDGEWLDQGVLDVQDLLQERLMQSLS
jgi:hypothetical protein